jgi:hypothetical protein
MQKSHPPSKLATTEQKWTSLILDIIQQKPLQVNHQLIDAQPEKQKREVF